MVNASWHNNYYSYNTYNSKYKSWFAAGGGNSDPSGLGNKAVKK
jgi:hypothetical protein